MNGKNKPGKEEKNWDANVCQIVVTLNWALN